MFLPERLAFIDVESTGAHPARDRLTEIAIVRVEHGSVVARWESLIAPGVSIPPLIQNLVGITDEMVADAPSFADIADTVATLLDDCVFVAHNARFDYGFIKNAFARMGRDFDAPVLCTVKLSRALYPEHHRHGLDALIERHGLTCTARHRAMGDVDAVLQFIGLAGDTFAPDVLTRAVKRAMKVPPQPSGLPEGVLEGVPDAPGVYLFFRHRRTAAERPHGYTTPYWQQRQPAQPRQGVFFHGPRQGCRTGAQSAAPGLDRNRWRTGCVAAGNGIGQYRATIG